MIRIDNFKFPKNCSHITKLITTVKFDATIFEIEKFLSNGVRIFHINLAVNTRDEINQILLRLETAISNHHLQNSRYLIPITKIFEIRGRISRVGRMLHGCPVRLKAKQKIILTSDPSYELCCLKEVTYVSNFEPYIPRLKLKDFIFINGKTIQLYIVKITGHYVTCCVLQKAKLNSYDEVLLPFYIPETGELTDDEIDDIDYSLGYKCNFIFAPLVTYPDYYYKLKSRIKGCVSLISCIDVYVQPDTNIITKIIDNFDGIWIKNLQANQELKFAVDCAKSMKKFSIVNWRDGSEQINIKSSQVDTVDAIAFDSEIYLTNILETLRIINRNNKESNSYPEKLRIPFRQDDPLSIIIKCSALSSGILKAKAIICISKTDNFLRTIINMELNCIIIAVVQCTHKAKYLNVFKNIFPLVYPEEPGKSDRKKCLECWRSKLEKRMKFATKFGLDVKWINAGDLVIFCFESNSGTLEPDSIRVSYVTNDKIVFCKK